MLKVIEQSNDPVTVEELSESSGLHPNTVRGHLDVLLAAGTVTREPAGAQGRGRPRWLYRAGVPVASPFRLLAEALTAELGRTHDPRLAESAAERWSHALPDLPRASSPDLAVQEATDALVRLGFEAVASPVGDAISITNCPYAELVDGNPVICDIHAALVVRLLEQTGQPVRLESMDVWTRRGMCVARLRRPDIEPARRIPVAARTAATAEERTDA